MAILEPVFEEGKLMIEKLKRIIKKNVDYLIARSQIAIRSTTIVKSWKKLLGEVENARKKHRWHWNKHPNPFVQYIPVCEDASSQEVESWMEEYDKYEITDRIPDEIADVKSWKKLLSEVEDEIIVTNSTDDTEKSIPTPLSNISLDVRMHLRRS